MFGTAWDRAAGQLLPSPRAQRRSCSKSIDLVQRMELQRLLEGHDGCVNTVAFDESGSVLVSGSDDQTIRVWDWERGSELLCWQSGHRNNVFQARFMPHTDNSVLVSCAADGQVRVADLPPGAGPRSVTSRKLAQHDGRAHRLALDPLNPRCCFYSCGEDGEVMHFDLRAPQARCRRRLLVCHGTPSLTGFSVIDLNCIHVNPARPELFAVGGGDEYVRVYDHRRASSGLGASPDPAAAGGPNPHNRGGSGRKLFGMADEPVARLAPARLAPAGGAGGAPRRRVMSKHVTGIQFSARGELLATYNDDDVFLFSPEGYVSKLRAAEAARRAAAERRASGAAAAAAPPPAGDGGGGEAGEGEAGAGGDGGLSTSARRRRRSGQVSSGDEPPQAVRRLRDSPPPSGSGGGGATADGGGARRHAWQEEEDEPDELQALMGADEQDGDEVEGEDEEEEEETDEEDEEEDLEDEEEVEEAEDPELGLARRRGEDGDAAAAAAAARRAAAVEEDWVIGTYSGHRNSRTVKGVSFMGADDEYVVSGSDDGHVYIWSKATAALLWWSRGDDDVVNCLEPHPFLPMTLATSGIDSSVKLWAPTAPERRPVPPEASRVMQRNRDARARGPDRTALPVSPELLRMLFGQRRARGGQVAAAGASESEGGGGEGSDDDEDGCRVS